jgi:hypothetical protein
MRNYILHIALFLGVLFLSATSFSQNDTIIVIDAKGEGDRIIKTTKKRSLTPILFEDTTQSQINSDFVFYEYTASSELQLQPISPARLKVVNPLEELKRGYVKVGVGNYLTPMSEVYYNSLRSKNNNWGIHGRHISSNTSIKNTGFSGLSENEANAFYQHFYKKFSVTGQVNYNRSMNHFYGFNPEDLVVLDNDSLKQVFNTIGGGINFKSFKIDTGDVNWDGTLNYTNYSDRYEAKENNVDFDLNTSKMIKKELFALDFGIDFNSYNSIESAPFRASATFTPNLETNNNTILEISPKIITSRKKLYASFGFSVFADINDKTSFHFYPNIEAKYSFLDIFIPYVGINGGLERNSFRSLSSDNPFVLSQVRLQNTNIRYNVYGGVRGSITNEVSFNVSIARQSIFGNALFVNDSTYSIQNKMDVIYDSMDVTELNAQITYLQSEKVRVFLKGKYSFFSPLNQAYVWNTPALDISLGGVYDLADKIMVRADIYYIGARKAKSLVPVADAELNNDNSYSVNQNAFFDFNLGFEYRYNKSISAFLNFNNIIGQKYQVYNQFPVQGINILGGATLRF